MDDAWFHTLTAAPAAAQEPLQHRRRGSLLQQPVSLEQKRAGEVVLIGF